MFNLILAKIPKTTILLLILCCGLSIKVWLDKKAIASLTELKGQHTQQIAHLQSVLSQYASQKEQYDLLSRAMREGIAEEQSKARIALQKVLKQSLPKDCKGSIEYLEREAVNVRFE